MIKTNISIIKDLKQNITLYEISFRDKVYSNRINSYIRKLRCLEKRVVSFNNYNKILFDNKRALSTLKEIHGSENFNVNEIQISFNNREQFLQRYIGEAISQQLRNQFEKLVITNKGKDWFKAVDYDKIDNYGSLSLFKGFRFKIIYLKNKIGIIIDPKSKFYTDLTLRDLYDNGKTIDERHLEKLCPVDCKQKFSPFATCEHANPESFGVMHINNIFKDIKPSEANDLIQHYTDNGCETGSLGNILNDRMPVIAHCFHGSNTHYYYPLELIRLSPKFEDAGKETRELTEEVVISPDERYTRMIESLDYFVTLKEQDFPIIIGETLNFDSDYLFSKEFKKINYIINNVNVAENPFKIIKKRDLFPNRREANIYVVLPHPVKDLLYKVDDFFDDFKRWYNCSLKFNFINIQTTPIENLDKKTGINDLYLFLKEDQKDVINEMSYLIKKGCKIHDIHLTTITGEKLFKKENIYAPIYHKLFSPFFVLDTYEKYEEVIGLAIQSYKNEKICSILRFKNNGELIKGYYIKESNGQIFNKKIEELLNPLNLKKNLIMINGFINSNIRNFFSRNEINYIEISDNSLVRLFRISYDQPSKSGVPSGLGIHFNNKWYLITYEGSHQGTQKSIKITNYGFSFDDFKDIAQICYDETRYHLGFSRNSIKLPFPVHFAAKKTLKKLKMLKINRLVFDYPIYL